MSHYTATTTPGAFYDHASPLFSRPLAYEMCSSNAVATSILARPGLLVSVNGNTQVEVGEHHLDIRIDHKNSNGRSRNPRNDRKGDQNAVKQTSRRPIKGEDPCLQNRAQIHRRLRRYHTCAKLEHTLHEEQKASDQEAAGSGGMERT